MFWKDYRNEIKPGPGQLVFFQEKRIGMPIYENFLMAPIFFEGLFKWLSKIYISVIIPGQV
jgi:hypothetical protein